MRIVQNPGNPREIIKSSWKFRGSIDNDKLTIGVHAFMQKDDVDELVLVEILRKNIEELHFE